MVLGFTAAAAVGASHAGVLGYSWSPAVWRWKLPTHLLFVGNWRTPGSLPSLIAPLWSVCVEEQFYLLFPLTFVFAKRHRPVFLSVFAGLLIVWMLRAMTPEAEAAFTTLRCDNLLVGALLAQLICVPPRS